MLWLLLGTAVLGVLLLTLRAFERASVGSIYLLLKWIGAFGGIALTALLLLSGRGPQALAGLVMVGPLLWRRWNQGGGTGSGRWGSGGWGFGGSGNAGSAGTPPPRRQSSAMSRAEAYEVLGLKSGANAEEIHLAHRRLMRMAHPDTGGSDWLASRINQARDVLLG
jgi:DnaJ homolog subfamily C member 19